MSFKFSKKDEKVQEYLNTIEIHYDCLYLGKQEKEWEYDEFLTIFKAKSGASEKFEFHTGLGHRIHEERGFISYKDRKELEKYSKSLSNDATVFFRDPRSTCDRIVKPTPASVLYCLLCNSDLGSESFESFCNALGWSTDSRKALEAYLECESNKTKLLRIFTSHQLEELKSLLEDY